MSINELNNYIDDKTDELIKDNNSLINAFNLRLNKRLIIIFNRYRIPFSSSKLDNIMYEYLIDSFKSINNEVSFSYKKLLYKYFDIINSYYHEHSDSKDKIKDVTSTFIKKLYSKENPILNSNISNNFINELKSETYVYDSYSLNKELETKIKIDVKEILDEINRSNKEYIIDILKCIIKYVLSGEE